MQASRGSRHRAFFPGEDGLIARFVSVAGGTLNVGRQGQPAIAFQQFDDRAGKAQAVELPFPAQHFDLQTVFQLQHATRLGRFACAHLREHLAVAGHTLNQHLDLAAAGLASEKTSVQHAGIVHHQQIAGLQQVGQVTKMAVIQAVVGHLQQTTGCPIGQRNLRDQVRRQVKVKIIQCQQAHRCSELHADVDGIKGLPATALATA